MCEQNNGQSYAAGYIFLPNKSSKTYKFLFTSLRDLLLESGPISLANWQIDFESSVLKEIKAVFGSKINVKGCHVHFRRNLRRRLAKIGLISVVNKVHDFHTFVDCLASLSFLPKGEIPSYYKDLMGYLADVKESIYASIRCGDNDWDEHEVETMIEQFLDGWEATYIGRKLRTGGRSLPRFDPDVWSQFDVIQELGQRTTNRNENLNSVFSKQVPSNSSIWTLIDRFRDHESKVRRVRFEDLTKIADNDQHSHQSGDPQTKRRSNQDLELRTLVNNRASFASNVQFLKLLTKYSSIDLD